MYLRVYYGIPQGVLWAYLRVYNSGIPQGVQQWYIPQGVQQWCIPQVYLRCVPQGENSGIYLRVYLRVRTVVYTSGCTMVGVPSAQSVPLSSMVYSLCAECTPLSPMGTPLCAEWCPLSHGCLPSAQSGVSSYGYSRFTVGVYSQRPCAALLSVAGLLLLYHPFHCWSIPALGFNSRFTVGLELHHAFTRFTVGHTPPTQGRLIPHNWDILDIPPRTKVPGRLFPECQECWKPWGIAG